MAEAVSTAASTRPGGAAPVGSSSSASRPVNRRGSCSLTSTRRRDVQRQVAEGDAAEPHVAVGEAAEAGRRRRRPPRGPGHDGGELARRHHQAAAGVDQGRAGRRLGRRPGGRLGLEGEDLHGPAGADQGQGELVGRLGDGADRQQQEGHIAVECDQLADADPAGQRQAGAQPGHRDHEHARQRHLGGVQQRLHPGRGHPGRPHLLGGGGVAAREHRLAADAAQHPQPAHRVGPDRGQGADQLAVAGPAPVQRAQRRPDGGRQQRHPGHHQQPQRGPGAQHQHRDHHERRQRAGQPGDDVHGRPDPLGVLAADGGDLAGGHAAEQRPAEPNGVAHQQLLDPVGGGQPVHHRGRCRRIPATALTSPAPRIRTVPRTRSAVCAPGNPLVDRPADQRRHHRQGPHPRHPVDDPERERTGDLPARHPQQKAGRRAQVRRPGMPQRQLTHPRP